MANKTMKIAKQEYAQAFKGLAVKRVKSGHPISVDEKELGRSSRYCATGSRQRVSGS